MATMTFDDLPEDEQAAFFDICADAEIDPAAFNISFTGEIPGDPSVSTGGRSAVVQYGSVTRAYEDEETTAWTAAFEDDVKAGIFS